MGQGRTVDVFQGRRVARWRGRVWESMGCAVQTSRDKRRILICEILRAEHGEVEVTEDRVGEMNGTQKRADQFLLCSDSRLLVVTEIRGDQDALSKKSYKTQEHVQSLELMSCITTVEFRALSEPIHKIYTQSEDRFSTN